MLFHYTVVDKPVSRLNDPGGDAAIRDSFRVPSTVGKTIRPTYPNSQGHVA